LPRTIGLRRFDYFDADELFDVYNATALRGLLFLLAVTDSVPGDAAAVGALAEHAATKVRGRGARDLIVTNAAILTLELIGTAEAIDELDRLRGALQRPAMIARVAKAASRSRQTLGRL
jgi:predicted RNA-binding Zn ribbon-like protein